jgi:hypothetical protein
MFIQWKKWWLGVEPIPTTSLLRQGTLIDSFITIKPHGRAFVMVSTWDVYKHSFFCQHMNCTVVLYTNTAVLLENGCTPFNSMPFPSTIIAIYIFIYSGFDCNRYRLQSINDLMAHTFAFEYFPTPCICLSTAMAEIP